MRVLDQAKDDLARFRWRDRFSLRDQLRRLPYDRDLMLSAERVQKNPDKFRIKLTPPYVVEISIDERNEVVVESILTEEEIDAQSATVLPTPHPKPGPHSKRGKGKK